MHEFSFSTPCGCALHWLASWLVFQTCIQGVSVVDVQKWVYFCGPGAELGLENLGSDFEIPPILTLEPV